MSTESLKVKFIVRYKEQGIFFFLYRESVFRVARFSVVVQVQNVYFYVALKRKRSAYVEPDNVLAAYECI